MSALGLVLELPDINAGKSQQELAKEARKARRLRSKAGRDRASQFSAQKLVREGLKRGIIKAVVVQSPEGRDEIQYRPVDLDVPGPWPMTMMWIAPWVRSQLYPKPAPVYTDAQFGPVIQTPEGPVQQWLDPGMKGLGDLGADAAATASSVIASGTQAFKDIWGTVKGTPAKITAPKTDAQTAESGLVPVLLIGAAAVGAWLILRSAKTQKGRR